MAAHPQFKTHETYSRIMLGFSYALAGATLAAIINFAWITPTPKYYVGLLVIPQFIWIAMSVSYMVAIYKGVMKKIPPLTTRKASLTPRRLSSYMPMWTVYVGYGLLLSSMAIYAWALMVGAIESETAIRRLFGIGVGGVVITAIILVTLYSKNSNAELIFGPSGRKVEVRFNVGMLYIMPLVGVFGILEDFFGISLLSTISFFVVTSIMIQTTFIVYSFHPKVRTLHREYRKSYGKTVTI
jgi:hypothetical protein